MARQTIARWLREHTQKLPDVKGTLLPATPNDVLELDEIWSFVQKKEQTRWLWTAMCRRTRQIVAFVIGDRSKATCLRLWKVIPKEYKHCHTFSDFWQVYRYMFPVKTHCCVGKETGGDGTHGTLEQYVTPTAWTLYATNTRFFQVR